MAPTLSPLLFSYTWDAFEKNEKHNFYGPSVAASNQGYANRCRNQKHSAQLISLICHRPSSLLPSSRTNTMIQFIFLFVHMNGLEFYDVS